MAVGSDDTSKAGEKRNRSEDPGVEATVKRIHDSENGKTCHEGVIALKECCHKNEPCGEDIVLPRGRPLTEVAGVEFPHEDVGEALQFWEFCKSFSEVLDIKKGQPECILRELVKGPARRRVSSSIVQFHVKLLSLIEEDIKEDDWVQALGRFITESQCSLDNLSLDLFEKGLSGYDSLSQSEKLRILNSLCNEILSTEKLRNWIDEDIAKHSEKMKENKQKVLALKKEEKLLNQKLSNDMAQAMISTIGQAPLPPFEVKAAISKIRNKADQELAALLKSIEQLPTKKQRCEAAGMGPIFLEGSGCAYWKLSYNSNSNIILQDIGTWDSVRGVDKWYLFNEDEEKEVENHIYSARNPETKQHKQVQENSSDDIKGASDDIKGAIGPTGGSNLTASSTLSFQAKDKVARLMAIMEMRASK